MAARLSARTCCRSSGRLVLPHSGPPYRLELRATVLAAPIPSRSPSVDRVSCTLPPVSTSRTELPTISSSESATSFKSHSLRLALFSLSCPLASLVRHRRQFHGAIGGLDSCALEETGCQGESSLNSCVFWLLSVAQIGFPQSGMLSRGGEQ